jgi:uncharacterized protein (DUF58 family)
MEEQDRGVPTLFVIPLVQFFVGCLLFVALLYGHRELAMLSLALLAVMAGLRLWARISLSRLECRLTVDKKRLFPNETVTLRVTAKNKKFLPIWLRAIVSFKSLMRSSARDQVLAGEGSLLWYQRTDFEWEVTRLRRGLYQVGPVRTVAGDLFAFYDRERRLEETHPMIVYPRLIPLQKVSFPRRDFFGIPGARSPVEDPIYILGTRDYQAGRPAKYIHWKASARHHRLQEKVLESTQQEKILLVLNVDPFVLQQNEEEFEKTLEVVASLAARLDEKGHAVGLVTNGVVVGRQAAFVPMARNERQLQAILEVLARLLMETEGALLDVLRSRLARSWGFSCVYFSLAEDGQTALVREYVREHRAPMTCFFWRPADSSEKRWTQEPRETHRFEEIILDGTKTT